MKKNGIILYTTCTLTPLENEGIVGIMKRKLGFEIMDAHNILSKVINPAAIESIRSEFSPGIARDENILQKIPFADSIHLDDLDRYLTLTQEDSKKLIRFNPRGEHSTGYFIALLQKKND